MLLDEPLMPFSDLRTILLYVKDNYDFNYKIIKIQNIRFWRCCIIEHGKSVVITAVYRSPASSTREFNEILQWYFSLLGT